MKNLLFLCLGSLFFTASCTRFRTPQPLGVPDLHEFPREMQGTFVSDDAKIIIHQNEVEYFLDKNRAPMKVGISDSLIVRKMAPWYIGTYKGRYGSGGDYYTVFALRLDEQNPNILHGLQTDDDEILQLLPNISRVTESHVVTTSNGKNDPPKDVIIFDPTPEEFRQIIEAAFEKKQKENGYQGFARQ